MDNPWRSRPGLCFAHQGGELEAPSNTMYAYKRAVALGAQALEIDLHATSDGHVIVCHDPTVDRTTDGSGAYDGLTLEQVKKLDAAHWFVPGRDSPHDAPDESYTHRGVALGRVPPPDGFSADDFRVPTLREVLEAFPSTFLNMDIKRSAPQTEPYEEAVAALLDDFGRRDDVIVASFSDETIGRFRAIDSRVTTAAATDEAADLILARRPGPFVFHALQVPVVFGDRRLVTGELVARAHEHDVAVHPWTVNDEAEMQALLDDGVDGVITSRPSAFLALQRERRTR